MADNSDRNDAEGRRQRSAHQRSRQEGGMNSSSQTRSGSSKLSRLVLELIFGAIVPIAIIILIFLLDSPDPDLYGLSRIPSGNLYHISSTPIGFIPLLIPFSIFLLSAISLIVQIIFQPVNPFIGGIIASGNLIYIILSVIAICIALVAIYFLSIFVSVSGCWPLVDVGSGPHEYERVFTCHYFLAIPIILLPIIPLIIIFSRSKNIYGESNREYSSRIAVFLAFSGGFIFSVVLSVGLNSLVKLYAERELDRLVNLSIGKNQVQVIELTNLTWLRPPLSWSIDVKTILEKRYIESGQDHGIGQLYRVMFGLRRSHELDRIQPL
jgi:hypothetical protein